jgi:hypothetical protein
MSDRVRRVGVLDQLGLRRGAGREVQQQRVRRLRRTIGREVRRRVVGLGERAPAVDRIAHGDPGDVDIGELVHRRGGHDDVPCRAADHPVAGVRATQQRRRRDEHRTELDRCEDRLPQLHLVAEHEDDPVAAAHTLRAEPIGDLVGSAGHLRERDPLLGTVLLDDPQRRPVVALRDHVEPIQRPVERVQPRPLEPLVRLGVVVGVLQQEVACLAERHRAVVRAHGSSQR